jgi:epoxyqueuosine reductase QueG
MTAGEWERLKAWIEAQAPVTVAAGSIVEIKEHFELGREQDLTGLGHAVSLAYPLPAAALGGIVDIPTLLYKHTYAQVNYLMDRVALNVSLRLQDDGHRAVAIPASQLIDWVNLKAHLNHRQVAVHLGQGWYGRNNLLVTPKRGAQVRLVTVLTDAAIIEPGPWAGRKGESGCGVCRACAAVCPVGAIHDGPENFELTLCSARLKEFEKMRGIGQRICGVCVKACSGPKKTAP